MARKKKPTGVGVRTRNPVGRSVRRTSAASREDAKARLFTIDLDLVQQLHEAGYGNESCDGGGMSEQHEANFNSLACRWLTNGQLRLAVTTERGPRIVFCGLGEGRNLLAETPEFMLPSPNGPLGLLGGHRLWYAPELPERTYGRITGR